MRDRTLLDVDLPWRLEDRAEEQIRSIPFEVPDGVVALEVALTHPADGATVLDLGLEGPSGYVGWSGGARHTFLVSEQWSTPGYLPTATTGGTWHVLLGLHRLPRDGTVARLVVKTADTTDVTRLRAAEPQDAPAVTRPSRVRPLPELEGRRWLAGDLHSHTTHSDGALPLMALAALAVARGLDFLAVTDHNTTSHHAHLPSVSRTHGITLIPGQEVTRDTGHANAFGDIGFVDFRMPQAGWATEVTARGGVFSINHPLAADCAWLETLPAPAVAEVWHSSWAALPTWGAPLAWWLTTPGTTPVGGSDFHHHGADALPGSPTTWVLCEGDDVLDGIRHGRTAVSASLDGPLLLRHGDEVIAMGADGLHLTQPGGRRRVLRDDIVRHPAQPGPCWLEDERRVVHALTR